MAFGGGENGIPIKIIALVPNHLLPRVYKNHIPAAIFRLGAKYPVVELEAEDLPIG